MLPQVIFAHKRENLDDAVRSRRARAHTHALLDCPRQVRDIFEEQETELSLHDPKSFFSDFSIVSRTDDDVRAAPRSASSCILRRFFCCV